MPTAPAATAAQNRTANSHDTCGVVHDRPIGGQQRTSHWESPKRQRTLSLTDEAWDLVSSLAEQEKLNRSEVIEILVRLARDAKVPLTGIRTGLLNSPKP